MGLPVLATCHAGIPEGIPRANHRFLAREHDPADLTATLLSLCAERNRWPDIGRRGREWVAASFSTGAEVASFRELLHAVSAARLPSVPGGSTGVS